MYCNRILRNTNVYTNINKLNFAEGNFTKKHASRSQQLQLYLVGTKDVGVVVEVPQGIEGVLVFPELHKAVAQRLALHLPFLRLSVIHHTTLDRGDRAQRDQTP